MNMTSNQVKNLLAFVCLFSKYGSNNRTLFYFAPDYVMEKFIRYVNVDFSDIKSYNGGVESIDVFLEKYKDQWYEQLEDYQDKQLFSILSFLYETYYITNPIKIVEKFKKFITENVNNIRDNHAHQSGLHPNLREFFNYEYLSDEYEREFKLLNIVE